MSTVHTCGARCSPVLTCLISGKIEMVKSKWGLALSAVITVVASLLISVSVCLMFGLTPSLSGR